MSKNVTIPLPLFYKLFNFIDKLDISGCPTYLKPDYVGILFALTEKKHRIEIRESYSKIINAGSEEERFDARMQYLLHKRENNEPF
jgi:hypothetical protein